MHVAQVIDILYYGGAQTMQVMFGKAMRKYPEVDLTVISLRDNTHDTHIPARLEAEGARVRFFPARKLFALKRFFALVAHLRQEKYDIVHTHLPYANILGVIAAKAAGVPVIASIRNAFDDEWGRFYAIRKWIETFVLSYLADHVMAVGETTAAVHQPRLGDKKRIEAVPSALEISAPLSSEERERARAEFLADPDSLLLIAVGRLVEQKGYADLLTALAKVLQDQPDLFLIVAGDGPLKESLEAQIKELGLGAHVRLLGARKDVPKLLLASDLYASSSLWEGMSVAILEAMAAGLPIVATKVSDTPRVVVEGTGILVPPRAPSQLAAAIATLAGDAEKRLGYGKAAQAYIQKNHNPVDWANQILAMYAKVMKA